MRSSVSASNHIVSRIETSESVVALTYDDGPVPEFTSAILDILDAHQAKATFFCVGKRLEAHAAVTQRAFRSGHEIGNHSYTHSNFSEMKRDAIDAEIRRTDQLIFSFVGQSNPLIRPPYGKVGPAFEAWLREANRTAVLFDVAPDPPDYLGADPILITEYVRQKIRPGSIVVLHDGGKENRGDRSSTVEATRYLVPILISKGYRCVTVSALIGYNQSPK